MKFLTKNSLSGENIGGRTSCEGSSPSFSTISKKQKTDLFEKLRKLDRKIAKLDETICFRKQIWPNYLSINFGHGFSGVKTLTLIERRTKLDLKRKEVRNQRKGYKISK